MAAWKLPKVCENSKCAKGDDGKRKVFSPKRWNQLCCSPQCTQQKNNARLFRKKAGKGAGGKLQPCNKDVSARRPWNGVIALFWRNGRFFNTERKLKSSRAVLKVRAEDGVVVSFRLLAQRREKSRDSGLGTRGSGRAAV